MTSSRVGMRRLRCSSERWTYNYQAVADDDQKTLSCVATVSGLRPVVQSVLLDIDCTYTHSIMSLFVCLSVCLSVRQCVSICPQHYHQDRRHTNCYKKQYEYTVKYPYVVHCTVAIPSTNWSICRIRLFVPFIVHQGSSGTGTHGNAIPVLFLRHGTPCRVCRALHTLT